MFVEPKNELVPTKFSIVTPSYGQLGWLEMCIASVADQARDRCVIEHLVQDGGSKGFEEFAGRIRSRFPDTAQYRLSMESEADAGMYDAINKGFRRSTGEVCAWLNCDEQYLPGTLDSVATRFERDRSLELLFGDVVLIDDTGMPVSYRRAILPDPTHIRFAHLNTLSCATFFRRTSVVDRGYLLDPKWKCIGDAVWVYGLLKAGLRVGLHPGLLAVFALTGQNLSADSLAREEMKLWRVGPGASAGWKRWPTILLHHLRKVMAGAYWPRRVGLEIYRPGSPERRSAISAMVSGVWPQL